MTTTMDKITSIYSVKGQHGIDPYRTGIILIIDGTDMLDKRTHVQPELLNSVGLCKISMNDVRKFKILSQLWNVVFNIQY
jgi:hypothetical protein